MRYSEAINLSNRSEHLKGTTDKKGFVIDDIWIVPVDENQKKRYMDSYMQYKDKERALKPFLESELEVWAVDTQFMEKANILFYDKIGG